MELQSVPPDLHLHLFDNRLLLRRHFIKPLLPKRDDYALAIYSNSDMFSELSGMLHNVAKYMERKNLTLTHLKLLNMNEKKKLFNGKIFCKHLF